ncbi:MULTISPECIES: SoxR reducing system RseC family protein [Dictyoglomus]|uniref:Positive regulator of sigma E, RseC/MucC n=1 Tax=Dictyoglomus turgidum (strain DSM 6724 / Z-1310) TaxID=515635 RepID=B8E0D0_DICTD|nr:MULTISPECIES: SoxR reducing system RseC family protein [Dictyoglomus]ACK42575.1 positive regulator of sigma E, RseC/MucC [Dictyoglomus turgidum DSM 6724]HBU31198.1 polyunsaturated fatty acid synthase PfaC [Dictyoglomus sp.]
MKEIGQVIEKNGIILKVKFSSSEACHSCGLCKINEEDLVLDVIDECNAKIGDFVMVEVERKDFYQVTFLIYLFPLISFILGVLIGYLIGERYRLDTQLLGLSIGLVFTVLSYPLIKSIYKKLSQKQKFIPVAKKIV